MSDDVLIEAGPLVALIDRSDSWHRRCTHTFEQLVFPPFTVWPVLAETSHILRRYFHAQSSLPQLIERGTVKIADLDSHDVPRIYELMTKYHDLPMDLVDAAIVRVAERERISRVFTIDQKDFRVYRPAHIRHFTLLPSTIFPA